MKLKRFVAGSLAFIMFNMNLFSYGADPIIDGVSALVNDATENEGCKTNHSWDDGEVTDDPTCTEEGEITYTCTECDETKTESIKETGHSWNDGEVTDEPTCTEAGEFTYTCTECDETKIESINEIGHSWNDGEVTDDPTCTEVGEFTYTCTECEETKTESIKETGHDWDDGVVTDEPTCTEEGVKEFTCDICNETKTETIEKLLHTYGDGNITKEATCDEEGIKEFACSVCGEIKIETIEKLPHTYGDGNITKEATCDEEGTKEFACSVCGEIKTETIEKLPHTYGDGNITKEATCDEEGTKEFACSVCGETKTEIIEKLPHTYGEGNITKEATCDEEGIKEFACSVCGETKTETIEKLPHAYGEGNITIAPTETTAGVKTYTCTVCTETKTEEIPATGNDKTNVGDAALDVPVTGDNTQIKGDNETNVGDSSLDVPVIEETPYLIIEPNGSTKYIEMGELISIITAFDEGTTVYYSWELTNDLSAEDIDWLELETNVLEFEPWGEETYLYIKGIKDGEEILTISNAYLFDVEAYLNEVGSTTYEGEELDPSITIRVSPMPEYGGIGAKEATISVTISTGTVTEKSVYIYDEAEELVDAQISEFDPTASNINIKITLNKAENYIIKVVDGNKYNIAEYELFDNVVLEMENKPPIEFLLGDSFSVAGGKFKVGSTFEEKIETAKIIDMDSETEPIELPDVKTDATGFQEVTITYTYEGKKYTLTYNIEVLNERVAFIPNGSEEYVAENKLIEIVTNFREGSTGKYAWSSSDNSSLIKAGDWQPLLDNKIKFVAKGPDNYLHVKEILADGTDGNIRVSKPYRFNVPLEKIEVTSMPAQTRYVIGEALNLRNGELTLYYEMKTEQGEPLTKKIPFNKFGSHGIKISSLGENIIVGKKYTTEKTDTEQVRKDIKNEVIDIGWVEKVIITHEESDLTTSYYVTVNTTSYTNGIVNNPDLADGMLPVKYVEGQYWSEKDGGFVEIEPFWMITTETDTNWYNYESGVNQWANVMLRDDIKLVGFNDTTGFVNDLAGKIVEVPGSMFVWIPRYNYTIDANTNKVSGIPAKITTEINSKTGDISYEKKAYLEIDWVKGTSGKAHSAFSFGETELSGFWMAKFEASQNEEDNTKIKVVPDVVPWGNIDVATVYDTSRKMMDSYKSEYGITEEKIDSHLIKNNEWGAVALLTIATTTTGKDFTGKIPFINNYYIGEQIKTGYSSSYQSAEPVTSESQIDKTIFAWNTEEGQKASTTHNIYGVYDMSGGVNELVAGYVNSTEDIVNDENYWNNVSDYLTNTTSGYAMSEVLLFWDPGDLEYRLLDGDAGKELNSSTSYILRGGWYSSNSDAGVFSFNKFSNRNKKSVGFRPVIILTNSLSDTEEPVEKSTTVEYTSDQSVKVGDTLKVTITSTEELDVNNYTITTGGVEITGTPVVTPDETDTTKWYIEYVFKAEDTPGKVEITLGEATNVTVKGEVTLEKETAGEDTPVEEETTIKYTSSQYAKVGDTLEVTITSTEKLDLSDVNNYTITTGGVEITGTPVVTSDATNWYIKYVFVEDDIAGKVEIALEGITNPTVEGEVILEKTPPPGGSPVKKETIIKYTSDKYAKVGDILKVTITSTEELDLSKSDNYTITIGGTKITGIPYIDGYTTEWDIEYVFKSEDTSGRVEIELAEVNNETENGEVIFINEENVIELSATPAGPALTNGNVRIDVTILENVPVKVMKYAKDQEESAYNGTKITNNKFLVSENGTYWVYVQDNAGNEYTKSIIIDYIDNTIPTIEIISITSNNYNTDYAKSYEISDDGLCEDCIMKYEICDSCNSAVKDLCDICGECENCCNDICPDCGNELTSCLSCGKLDCIYCAAYYGYCSGECQYCESCGKYIVVSGNCELCGKCFDCCEKKCPICNGNRENMGACQKCSKAVCMGCLSSYYGYCSQECASGNPINASNQSCKVCGALGDKITVTMKASQELVNLPTVTIGGKNTTVTTNDNINFTATYTPSREDNIEEGLIVVEITKGRDAAGNNCDPIKATKDRYGKTVTYDITKVQPTISTPNTYSTQGEEIYYTVSFSDVNLDESTIDITAADFELETTGTAKGVIQVVDTDDNLSKKVYVKQITGEGTIKLKVLGINSYGHTPAKDMAGNTTSALESRHIVSVDTVRPEFTTISIASNNSLNTEYATNGDTITLTLESSEQIQKPDVTIMGRIATVTTSDNRNFIATYKIPDAEKALLENQVWFEISNYKEYDTTFNNAGRSYSETTDESEVLYDRTKPTAVISEPSLPEVAIETAKEAEYTITYSDDNFDISTLTVEDIELVTNGVTADVFVAEGNGSTRIVTLSNISGIGSVGINIKAGSARDKAGNLVDIVESKKLILVDTELPEISGVTIYSNNTDSTYAKNGDTIYLEFTASEEVNADVIIADRVARIETTNNKNFRASYEIPSGENIIAEGIIEFTINFKDLTQNVGNQIIQTNDESTVCYDRTKAVVTFEPNGNVNVNQKQSTIITLNDVQSGLLEGQTYQYAWSDNNVNEPAYNEENTFVNGQEITGEGYNGTYYLWIKTISDKAGNETGPVISNAFKFDNTLPTIDVTSIKSNNNNSNYARHYDVFGKEMCEECIEKYGSTTTCEICGNTVVRICTHCGGCKDCCTDSCVTCGGNVIKSGACENCYDCCVCGETCDGCGTTLWDGSFCYTCEKCIDCCECEYEEDMYTGVCPICSVNVTDSAPYWPYCSYECYEQPRCSMCDSAAIACDICNACEDCCTHKCAYCGVNMRTNPACESCDDCCTCNADPCEGCGNTMEHGEPCGICGKCVECCEDIEKCSNCGGTYICICPVCLEEFCESCTGAWGGFCSSECYEAPLKTCGVCSAQVHQLCAQCNKCDDCCLDNHGCNECGALGNKVTVIMTANEGIYTAPTVTIGGKKATVEWAEGATTGIAYIECTNTIPVGKMTVVVSEYKDIAENIGNTVNTNKGIDGNGVYYDGIKPTISLSENSNSTASQTHTTIVTIKDEQSGLDSNIQYYAWNTSKTITPSVWNPISLDSNGSSTIEGKGLNGTHYLWIKTLSDKAGNTNSHVSEGFKFDNGIPVLTNVTIISNNENNTNYATSVNELCGECNSKYVNCASCTNTVKGLCDICGKCENCCNDICPDCGQGLSSCLFCGKFICNYCEHWYGYCSDCIYCDCGAPRLDGSCSICGECPNCCGHVNTCIYCGSKGETECPTCLKPMCMNCAGAYYGYCSSECRSCPDCGQDIMYIGNCGICGKCNNCCDQESEKCYICNSPASIECPGCLKIICEYCYNSYYGYCSSTCQNAPSYKCKGCGKISDKITVTMTSTEPIYTAPTVIIGGKTADVHWTTGSTTGTAYVYCTNLVPEGNVSIKISGYKDISGNEGNIVTQTTDESNVYCDRTAPYAMSIIGDNNGAATSNTENTVSLTGKASDNTKIVAYAWSVGAKAPTSGWTTITEKSDITQINSGIKTKGDHYFHVKDIAGNTSSIKTTVYEMTFNDSEGVGAPKKQYKAHGVDLKLPATIPTRTGYTFDAWRSEGDAVIKQYQPGAIYTQDVDTIFVVNEWVPNEINVQINHNLQNANDNEYALIKTEKLTLPYATEIELADRVIYEGDFAYTIPTKTYELNETEYTEAIIIVPTTDIIIDINYARETYELTLNTNTPYISSVTGAGEYRWGQNIAIKAELAENETGYTNKWLGWSSSNVGLIPEIASSETTIVMPKDDITLTAKATRDANTVTVEFKENGGIVVGVSSKVVTFGDNYGTLPTAIRTGYTFDGWNTMQDGSGEDIQSNTTVTNSASHELYAKWSANSIAVNFDPQGGSTVTSKAVTYGETYGELTTPTRAGWTFEGWFLNGVQIAADAIVTTTVEHTLVARWTKTITLIYNINGGDSEAPATQSYTIVSPETSNMFTISNIQPTRSRYTFAGWSTSAGAEKSNYTAGGIIILNSSATLYAVWEKNQPATLAPSNTWYSDTATVAKENITTINIEDYYTGVSYDECWAADVDGTGSIMCYVTGTTLTIAGNDSGKICANADSASLFAGFTGVTAITGLNLLDTSKVTNMRAMFNNCSGLISLDVSSFNTSNVTDMAGMFNGCSALMSLNLSSFDTLMVMNMNAMFQNCGGLITLDISNFDTSKVTNMKNMFNKCSSLTSLDLSNFNTSNVINMAGMFQNCSSLTSLDISEFNTSNVTDMMCMFNACQILTSLDLSNFNTSNVTNMVGMFQNCSSLTSIDISSFNTSKVIDMNNMFKNCTALTNLDVSSFDTSKVTDMRRMFAFCELLTSLDLSSFNTSKVTNMLYMFTDCKAMTSLDISNFDTSNATDMTDMFYGMLKLQEVKLGEKFSFTGNGTTSCKLSTPINANIEGADGKWYLADGTAYLPAEIPSNIANTYYAVAPVILAANSTWYTSATTKSTFKTINIVDTYTGAYSECWNAGINGTGSVKAYINGTTLVIAGNGTGKIYANADSASLFAGFTGVTAITGLTLLDTSKATTMYGMFNGCSKLTSLDLSEFDTSKVTDMVGMFNGCSSLTTLDLSNFNTRNVTTMRSMFQNCSSLTSLDLSSFNTSKVTAMNHMFNKCSSLTTLDVSSFDTSNVTTMRVMFQYCSSLTSLDLSNFDTSKVTLMDSMFASCTGLTNLNVSSFDTIKVTNMYGMFYECSALTSLNVNSFDTSNVTDMSGMFKDCKSLTSLDLRNFNTSNVTLMNHMFYNCNALTSLDVSSFNTSRVTDMMSMFCNCNVLTSLDLINFDTRNVTNMSHMFDDCNALASLDLSYFDTRKVTTMKSMFYNCNALTSLDLSSFNTSNVTDMYSMFLDCTSLISLDLRSFNTSRVTNMNNMLKRCSSLVSLDLSSFDTGMVSDIQDMFAEMIKLQEVKLGEKFSFVGDGTTSCTLPAQTDVNIPGADGKWYLVDGTAYLPAEVPCNVANTYYAVAPVMLAANNTWYTSATAKSTFTTINIVDTYTGAYSESWNAGINGAGSVKAYINGTTLVIAGNGVGKIYANADSSNLFKDFTKVTTITGLNLLDTSKVTNMYGMFANCNALTSLDISNFDTQNVTNMYGMFANCNALTSLDISNFNTSKVTTMRAMFQNCQALTSLDLSNFNTREVTNMRYMFNKNKALTSLDISSFDTSKVTDMYGMFNQCNALISVDVSNFDTRRVTDMTAMFNYCHALTNVNVSNFDTRNVTNMSYMFEECYALTSIDVSNFNTRNVTDMKRMFYNCNLIEELDMSNFDTSKATDMISMFYGMTKLQEIKLGEKFSFTGDGTASCVLPTPANENIAGADGKWYLADGTAYLPAEVPSNVANTYYAISNNAGFTVNHYLENADDSNYTLYGTETKSALKGSIILVSSLNTNIANATYNHGKVGSSIVTTTTVLADGSTVINLYYTRNTFELTFQNNGITSIKASYKWGREVSLNATIGEGYTWKGWYYGNGSLYSTSKATTIIMPTNAMTLNAVSESTGCTITVSANSGGTVSPSTTTVNVGTNKTFTITPDNEFYINSVIVDGETVASSAPKKSTFVTDDTFTVTGSGSYPWTVSGDSFISSNNSVASSTSTSTITLSGTGTLSFDYSVSSEGTYDKLTITVADSTGTKTVANAISGTISDSYTADVSGDITITLTYTKDSSTNTGDDRGTISNLTFTKLLTDAYTYEFTNVQKNHTLIASFNQISITPSETYDCKCNDCLNTVSTSGAFCSSCDSTLYCNECGLCNTCAGGSSTLCEICYDSSTKTVYCKSHCLCESSNYCSCCGSSDIYENGYCYDCYYGNCSDCGSGGSDDDYYPYQCQCCGTGVYSEGYCTSCEDMGIDETGHCPQHGGSRPTYPCKGGCGKYIDSEDSYCSDCGSGGSDDDDDYYPYYCQCCGTGLYDEGYCTSCEDMGIDETGHCPQHGGSGATYPCKGGCGKYIDSEDSYCSNACAGLCNCCGEMIEDAGETNCDSCQTAAGICEICGGCSNHRNAGYFNYSDTICDGCYSE